MTMKIDFWGVRGSIATPGPETARVGGNTSCVEIVARAESGETRIVLDAGTGMRKLGRTLAARGPVETTILLSHLHWDHIQGIPFFAPIYMPTTKLDFIAGSTSAPLETVLRRQMSAPTFPVDLRDVPSQLSFRDVRDGERFDVGGVKVTATRANHPDASYAYRLERGGRSIVYATDTEHYACVDPRLVQLARGADVLIYDAQYLPEEYRGEIGPTRVGWGHSTYEAGAALANAAGVSSLVLFHHDPMRDDDAVHAIVERTKPLFSRVIAAIEGETIELADVTARAA